MPSDFASRPVLLILNQMAGPLTWELAEDLGECLGPVTLLTGHPDTLAKGSTPAVRVVPAASYQRGSFLQRALSWLHYFVQAFSWLWRWDRDIPLLVYSNPPILCWLGLVMRGLRGQRYAVVVHDVYPDVLVRLSGFSEHHPLIRAWRWLNRYAYQRADVVITLGECMKATLAEQFDPVKTKAGEIQVIYPWVDTEKIKPLPKGDNWFAHQYGQVDKLTVMYSGNMGLGHDIETMISAARELLDLPDIHFMFIGSGPKWNVVQQVLQNERLPNVTLLGWQPEATLPYSLATADIAWVSLEPGMEGLAVPSKAIFALSAGSGLMVRANPESELANWAERFGCGLVLNGGPDELAAILRGFVRSPELLVAVQKKARVAAEAAFDRTANTRRAVDCLRAHLNLVTLDA